MGHHTHKVIRQLSPARQAQLIHQRLKAVVSEEHLPPPCPPTTATAALSSVLPLRPSIGRDPRQKKIAWSLSFSWIPSTSPRGNQPALIPFLNCQWRPLGPVRPCRGRLGINSAARKAPGAALIASSVFPRGSSGPAGCGRAPPWVVLLALASCCFHGCFSPPASAQVRCLDRALLSCESYGFWGARFYGEIYTFWD